MLGLAMDRQTSLGEICAITVAVVAVPAVVLPQTSTTSNCYQIGATWHCDAQTTDPRPGAPVINFSPLATPPNYVGAYINGYAAGQALAAQREADRQAALLRETLARDPEALRDGRSATGSVQQRRYVDACQQTSTLPPPGGGGVACPPPKQASEKVADWAIKWLDLKNGMPAGATDSSVML